MLHNSPYLNKYVVSMDLDRTFLNTLYYEAELTEEFVTLGYYCQVKKIPFFITTNRSKQASILNMKCAVGDGASEEAKKKIVEQIYIQTLQYAIEKIKAAGLDVVYCTVLDAAGQEAGVDSIITFEEKIIGGDENPSLEVVRQRLISDEIEAEVRQEILELTDKKISLVKYNHFAWIASKCNPQHILHIDDSEKICDAIKQQKEKEIKFDVQPFEVKEGDGKSNIFSPMLYEIGVPIGLAQEADALLENIDLINTQNYLLSFSLIRYLIHTSSPNSKDNEKIYGLIQRFDELHILKLNPAQRKSWDKLKIPFNRTVEQQVVADFFKKYDQKFKEQNRFLCFFPNPFINSEWPKDAEERKKISIEDIILHAMKNPGNNGNRTAKILQTDYYLKVEQDLHVQESKDAIVTDLESLVFRKVWSEVRTLEAGILKEFYELRNAELSGKRYYRSQSKNVDKPEAKRSIVNLIESTKPSRLASFLPKWHSGDRTHRIFKSELFVNTNTRVEKTSEQITKDLFQARRSKG